MIIEPTHVQTHAHTSLVAVEECDDEDYYVPRLKLFDSRESDAPGVIGEWC
jgi:hypothetical protein